MRPLPKYLAISGLAAAILVAVVVSIWSLRTPEAEAEDEAAVRARAIAAIDRKLHETRQWSSSFQNGSEFDTWLLGLRTELRPVLSAEFDSRLISVLREFGAHAGKSGPMLDHSRQLALVSARSLLEEERSKFEDPSNRSENANSPPEKPVRFIFPPPTESW